MLAGWVGGRGGSAYLKERRRKKNKMKIEHIFYVTRFYGICEHLYELLLPPGSCH